jgi:CheY-like chemotaxis protein
MGFADLLRESVEHDHNLIRYCDNIITAANRSSDLTAQLLAYARKGKYQNIAVDMHGIIEEVVTLLEQSIDKRVEIDMQLYARNCIVNGDPGQLQGVCMNIAINARDAMPYGGRITFNTAEVFLDEAFCARSSFELTSGSYLKIMIRDNGTGMRVEIVAHIFEPFFTTKQVGEGTGIGLSAAYGTVKNHNGAIEVESEEGEGSVFTVYLPLVPQKEIDLNEQKRTQQSIQGKGHILLVDDEEMMCDVGEKMLNTLGYEVTTAKNGAEAVEFFSQHHSAVDCVILDMVMPVMGGKEAFIAMRDINPDVPALLSTGYSIKGEAEEILAEGVKGFIQKPFTKAEFSQKIAAVMGRGDDA